MGNGKYSEIHSGNPEVFAFADVVVDTHAHRLTRGGRDVPVEPKVFAVLLHFLEHPGQLLSRDELLDAVWGHSCVTPSTLSRVISQLRRAVADDTEQPRYIQTVHRLGYRFIAPLKHASGKPAVELRFAPPARARLPARTHTLIGREHDIDQVADLLRKERLVTIAGAGGVGKTQVALEAARSVAGLFPDGVWLLDCTSQLDGQELTHWLSGMFDIRATAGVASLASGLAELLRPRHVLLVFDNCERIAGPMAIFLEALLAASVAPRVLVTSQHRLNCSSESLYWLPPLDVPEVEEWITEEDIGRLSQVSSVQLLLTRLRAFASSFALTQANATAVAEICRRLDGLPLALEIAAARLRLLSPEQLLQRMDAHLLNLAEASPSRPARHQTLHALIEWSFALLSDRERSLLTGLSVFAGACTLGGANAVGKVFGLDDDEVMDVLGGLVDKSLLVVDTAAHPPSYRLLDSVRQFSQEKLAESGDETFAREAHLAHFIEFTQHVNAEIRTHSELLWCERVRREWANLLEAYDYALSRADGGEDALALSGNLCWYFRMGTNYIESARWVDRSLAAGRAPTRARAQALIASGIMHHQSQVHERAGVLLREGIALAKQLEETQLAGMGYAVLAFELATCGQFMDAEACAAAAETIAQRTDDPWLRSLALLGRGVALALNEMHHESEVCLDEAYRAVSGPDNGAYQPAYVLINRALQRFYLGRFPDAAHDWLSDLDAFAQLDHWRGMAGCVEGAAYLASERGQVRRTARFLAAAARVRELSAAPLMPQWRKAQAVAECRARDGLGRGFAQAQHEGHTARFEEIVVEARLTLLEEAETRQPARLSARSPY